VQVIDRNHPNAAGDYAKRTVLNSLQFLNMGWRGVGEPNGSCIHEKGQIGDKYGFLLLTPVGTSRGY